MRSRVFVLCSTVVGIVASSGLGSFSQAAVANYYWTDRDAATVNMTTAAGVTTQLVPPTGGRLQDVDLAAGGTLYFTDWGPVGLPGGQGKINRVSTSGGVVTNILTTSDGVHQIALDQANGKIYYTQGVSYDTRHIGVVDTSGANHVVLQSESSWFPSGIALDAANGKIYWGDIGVIPMPFGGTVNVMETDGTLPAVLAPHLDGRGRGFALHNGNIYLTQHGPLAPNSGGAIYRYDIVAGTLTQLIADPNGLWDIEIDPAEQRMYWTNYAAGTIESALLDGSDRRIDVSGLTSPYGLALEFVGACCTDGPNTESECIELSREDCDRPGPQGGLYLGDGTVCANVLDCVALVVTFDSLSATATPEGVLVRWVTTVEFETVGFRLLRETAGQREKVLGVVAEMIPAAGNGLTGASYEFLDNSDQSASAVNYYIEDIDVFGRVTRHGPIAVDRGVRQGPTPRVNGEAARQR